MPKPTLKRLPPRKRPRKAKAGTRGAAARDSVLRELSGDALATKAAIEQAGGVVTGQYLDPIGAQPLLLAVLPIDQVEPTPFQRDVSDSHHKRLADVIDRTGIFSIRSSRSSPPNRRSWPSVAAPAGSRN